MHKTFFGLYVIISLYGIRIFLFYFPFCIVIVISLFIRSSTHFLYLKVFAEFNQPDSGIRKICNPKVCLSRKYPEKKLK